ncbi:hypothetical protein KGY73_10970 [bacterium]|nr:hypothetical protein [bacterium]
MSIKFTAVITKEENWYVSHCVELGDVIPIHDELAKGTRLGILKQCSLT